MARVIWAAALALLIASTSTVGAQQGARASRWQPDQFGPIVPTDTMWSIASYYGRQRGVSVNVMMEQIVANNPRAFRDNRPDFMLTGFYLNIPGTASTPTTPITPQTAQAEPPESTTTAAGGESTTVSDATDEAPQSVAVENEIAISVSELQALRTQLSESISLIENLQGENGDLQARLTAVTMELDALKARADEEIQASSEMASLATVLEQKEDSEEASLAALTVAEQATADAAEAAPSVPPSGTMDTPASELTAPEPQQDPAEGATDANTTVDASAELATEITAADNNTTDTAAATVPAKPAPAKDSAAELDKWLAWLMKPLHLAVSAGVLVLLLVGLWYALYLRRVNQEWDEEAVEVDERELHKQDAEVEQEATDAAAPSEIQVDDDVAEAAAQASVAATQSEWHEQEDSGEQYAEVSDVDLDAYLREQQEKEQRDGQETSESGAGTAPDDVETDEQTDEHYDELSQEVDALLAMSVVSDAEPEAADTPEVSSEDVAPAPAQVASDDELEPEAMDSFGGLRLDDESAATTTKSTDATASEHAAETDEDGYLSIESLIEEADEEASKEQDDPYNKDKLSDALGGDDKFASDFDLDVDALQGESSSMANQLDLAQVYIDMGEVDEARTLLNAIASCGDEEVEREANELLQQLNGQGSR